MIEPDVEGVVVMHGAVVHLAAEVDDGDVVARGRLVAQRQRAERRLAQEPVGLAHDQVMGGRGPMRGGDVVPVPQGFGGLRVESELQPVAGDEARSDGRLADEAEPAGRCAVVDDGCPSVEAVVPIEKRAVDLAVDLEAGSAGAALGHRRRFEVGRSGPPGRPLAPRRSPARWRRLPPRCSQRWLKHTNADAIPSLFSPRRTRMAAAARNRHEITERLSSSSVHERLIRRRKAQCRLGDRGRRALRPYREGRRWVGCRALARRSFHSRNAALGWPRKGRGRFGLLLGRRRRWRRGGNGRLLRFGQAIDDGGLRTADTGILAQPGQHVADGVATLTR